MYMSEESWEVCLSCRSPTFVCSWFFLSSKHKCSHESVCTSRPDSPLDSTSPSNSHVDPFTCSQLEHAAGSRHLTDTARRSGHGQPSLIGIQKVAHSSSVDIPQLRVDIVISSLGNIKSTIVIAKASSDVTVLSARNPKSCFIWKQKKSNFFRWRLKMGKTQDALFPKKLIPKTIGNGKRDCAWGCAWGINTTWENLQIEKHKSGRRSLRSPNWFVLFDLQIFSGGVYSPSATSRTISFSISNSFWY